MPLPFFDYAASCPTAPEVIDAMHPLWCCANPASDHAAGRAADAATTKARERLAAVIGAKPGEVVFTSSATESNNMAIKGWPALGRDRIIVTNVEHKSVLKSCEALRGDAKVGVLRVDTQGRIDIARLHDALRDRGRGTLVSVQAVNNETGVIQPVRMVAEACRIHGAMLHCDAAQALGRLDLDVHYLGVHMMSLSGHKCYGPKGVGALFVREGVDLAPLLHGGRQEHGLRAGTSSPPLVAGFAKAAELARGRMEEEYFALDALRTQLVADLERRSVPFVIAGEQSPRVPGITCLCFPGCAPEAVIREACREICCSAGAACGLDGPSHVLAAMGHSPAALRISMGRWTKPSDVEKAADAIAKAARAGAA